jgi:hypothetical protein
MQKLKDILTSLYVKSPRRVRTLLWRIFYLWKSLEFYLNWHLMRQHEIRNINFFEKKVFSQHGEDGIIQVILDKVGVTNKYCVEFGVGDGSESCTRYLVERQGWSFLWMDGSDSCSQHVKREFITAENICALFEKYKVPREFDVLSIDIDYNTYWVWKAIRGYFPRLVVVEYNGFIPVDQSKAVPYVPNAIWDGSTYFGASLLAMSKLGESKGYTLVGCYTSGTNAFFVRNDLVANNFLKRKVSELYKPAIGGHRKSRKAFIDV